MGAVAGVARRRLAGRWRGLLAAGLLLGIAFGVSFASFAAADAPLGLRPVAGRRRRARCGRLARPIARGFRSLAAHGSRSVAAACVRGLPRGRRGRRSDLHDGAARPDERRVPDRAPAHHWRTASRSDAADEAFMNADAASAAGLAVGDQLRLNVFNPLSGQAVDETVTIVGVGTYPQELARDETNVFGVVILTRVLRRGHRDLQVYGTSNVDLARRLRRG